MTGCGCPACSDEPLATYTPKFLLECEARELLRWPLKARQEYLNALPVRARKPQLEAELLRLWEQRKAEKTK